MRSLSIIILSFVLIVGLEAQSPVDPIDQKGLEKMLSQKNDTIYVINFWATWCSPCVKELPYFDALHRDSTTSKLVVNLISLDFPNQVEARVVPFLKDNGISAPVFNMTEMDYNAWIPIVDSLWSGSIPATLIFRGDKSTFIESEVTREELFEAVNDFNH